MSRAASTTAAVAGPSAFVSVLREGAYRRLWCSGLCVNGARWMDLVLLGWLAFQLTDSPFMVGLAAFARSAPLMVRGPFTGLLADRMHRGRVLASGTLEEHLAATGTDDLEDAFFRRVGT